MPSRNEAPCTATARSRASGGGITADGHTASGIDAEAVAAAATASTADQSLSRSSKAVGFDTMSAIDYEGFYPMDHAAFIRRIALAILKAPLAVTLLSMGLQWAACGGSEGGSSWSEWLWGVEMNANGGIGQTQQQQIDSSSSTSLSSVFFSLSPEMAFCVMACATRIVTGAASVAFYYFVEKYHLLEAYKIPRPPAIVPSASLLRDSYRLFAVDTVLNPLLTLGLLKSGLVYRMMDVCEPIALLPTWGFMLASFITNETGFYWVHRLFHEVPFLYKHIHKQHHKYIGSVAIATEYSNPLERLFANTIPFIFVMFFAPTSPIVMTVWLFSYILESFEAHCGYCFHNSRGGLARWCRPLLNLTFANDGAFHDYHHIVFKGNYGQGGIFWDYVCGTDTEYAAKIRAARDRQRRRRREG